MLAVTIGNFDGVHRGHVALLRAAQRHVGPSGRTVAVTFEPHPMARLRPDRAPERLTDASERRTLLEAAGADEVVELEPTPELLAFSPEQFVGCLRERLPFSVVVEGQDFRFGKGRAGTVESLRKQGAAGGFALEVVPPVEAVLADRSVVTVSSTLVRWLIRNGRVRDAATVLGRPYALVGPTARGDQRGRTIGVPTMNMGPLSVLLPADGVYAGTAVVPDGRIFPAAISIGTKPSFGRSQRTCEAHLLEADFPLDWYGFTLRLEFRHWIRGMVAFGSLAALLGQIERDILATRQLVDSHSWEIAS